ncbi:ABC transporter ATP-binding protein [Pontibacter ruber]|uniref:ABC transporter ATP-binding protein n=1 Tax=Pontibacter ruber TaxID=1343895 RepID=A0ABW5D299_9BACT|nr:ABC transporter ATP-binding protein [Pontibacter ruber]
MSFLEVNDIRVAEEGNEVLKGISFTQQEFQKIAIAGETGSGKSTLLQTIAGLVQPASGEVLFENKRVQGPHEVLVPGHPGIAYLSQQFELPQFLRVEQVLRYANTLSEEQATTLYEVCRISHLAKRKTNQLSGGERQRIALARLLTSWPGLLLMDEPFSNLDIGHKNILKSVIQDIGEYLDITCILISHDPLDTLSWADEILVLKEGRVIQRGTPKYIYSQPADEYTAALFGGYNLLSQSETEAFAALTGTASNGKQMLIRPENFRLVNAPHQALSGKVNKVQYFGSYSEVEVQLAESLIKIRTAEQELTEGDTVQVTLSPADVWFV